MSQKSVEGSKELAYAIKARRNELQMTIEDAADKANVGTKTWCRYEAGESIRQDKCKGICKALNWRSLPCGTEKSSDSLNIDEYRHNEYWSNFLETSFGETAALSFIIGSEILEDSINDDLSALSKMPRGSHIGEIGTSFLADDLPPQFLTSYDFDFVYALRCSLRKLKSVAKCSAQIVAHSVLEELTLYLIVEKSRILIEDSDYTPENNWDNWIFDLFDDMDIVTHLYSDEYMTSDYNYHFDYWQKEQFFMN